MSNVLRKPLAAIVIVITLGSILETSGNRRHGSRNTGVAFVYLTRGTFHLRRGGRTRIVRTSELLNVGDRVTMDDGSQGTIYQTYAPAMLLYANQSQTIAKLSPPPPELAPERYQKLISEVLRARRRRDQPSPTSLGPSTTGFLTLLDWRNGTVLERRPEFAWTTVNGASQYEVNLFDHTDRIIWTAKTSETRIIYPEARPALSPGKYKWEVIAQVDSQWSRDPALYDASAFTLVSYVTAARIEKDLAQALSVAGADGSANLVYVSALLSNRRFAQAESYLRESLERGPHDQSLWDLLIETYFQMKLWGAREEARRLSKTPQINAEMIRSLRPSK